MNVSLTEKQKKYIASQIKTGDYQNASELVRDALRLHEVYRIRIIEELRAEIAKGWESPVSSINVDDIIDKKRKEYKK